MNGFEMENAGRLLREHVDAGGSPDSMARARLIDAVQKPRSAQRAMIVAATSVGALAVIVLLLVLTETPTQKALTFQVGEDLAPGQVGSHVASEAAQQIALRFSEGSVITLEPEARARVAETSAHGASVLLETGQASVHVVPHPDSAWRIVAGPYTVQVKGTAFDVSWTPAEGKFDLTMHAGVVWLTGPNIAQEVREGEHVVHLTSTGRAATGVDPSPSSTFAGSAPTLEPVPSLASATPNLPSPSASRPTTVSWETLVAQGSHKKVLEAAEKRGLQASLDSAGPGDLMALAHAARYAGKGSLARRALMSVRSRFPSSSRAASAAFLLGRMSGNSKAIGWYDRYMAEAPNGAFAAEAAGRRMLALRSSGDSAGARRAAEYYLRRFPKGPYAGVARDMAKP